MTDISQDLLSRPSRERFKCNLSCLEPEDDSLMTRRAAVLVPLCEVDGQSALLYTLRSAALRTDGGQVCFPGGKAERGESSAETALREAFEEIGLPAGAVELWCEMPVLAAKSKGMAITPVVGYVRDLRLSQLVPNRDEVSRIFTVPLRALCDRRAHGRHFGTTRVSPVFVYEEFVIWGITGLITNNFLQCLLPGAYEWDVARRTFSSKEVLPK